MNAVDITNEVGWCVAVIRHAASNARRTVRRRRIEQPQADEMIDAKSLSFDNSFSQVEWEMLLSLLEPRERDVIYRIYILGQPQHEVAEHLHISQQHVSRLKSKGLTHLRIAMNE